MALTLHKIKAFLLYYLAVLWYNLIRVYKNSERNFIFMKKTELVQKAASDAEITQQQAAAALDSFIESITAALVAGDKVSLAGFGTFETKLRAARTYLNPQTKEKVEVSETRVPSFKVAKALKDLLKG